MERSGENRNYIKKTAQLAAIISVVIAIIAYIKPLHSPSPTNTNQKIPVYLYNVQREPCTDVVVISPDGSQRIYPNGDGILYVSSDWLGKEISIRNPQKSFREIQTAKILPNKDGKVVIIVNV